MKVMVCPSDQSGCGMYRMIWPAQALIEQGHDVVLQRRPRILVNQRIRPPQVMDAIVQDVDVIVFQRPGSYQITQLIPILHKKGIKVVVDMDDDLGNIHPANYAHKLYDPKRSPDRNWDWVAKACEMADLVTVTTEELAQRYGSRGRVVILPNCIPSWYLEIKKKINEIPTVGWAGYTLTHPDDLQTTHGAINQALAKQHARFMAIGDYKRIFERLGIRNKPPHLGCDGVVMNKYPETVAQLDIGIVPLADSKFNRSKSWLKGLEYAALGVAPVVSPTPDNMKLLNAGAAYVARSPKTWLEVVRTLITNDDERVKLAESARQFASEQTIEANAWRWWSAWCKM